MSAHQLGWYDGCATYSSGCEGEALLRWGKQAGAACPLLGFVKRSQCLCVCAAADNELGLEKITVSCGCARLQTLRVPVSVTEQEEVQVRPPYPDC